MIKYLEFDSIDEYGTHIEPAFPGHGIKLASQYSAEIANFLSSMSRDPKLYYVVINALGSYEGWGPNRNGDAFPEEGLTHVSLRTDMGTPNDYGYKTFEYYAKLYKHHVNKDPNKSFGDVVFSSWNPRIRRVELVVGIYRDKGASIIDAIESGKILSVSMGCKVLYDRCSICGNKAKTKEQYCKHVKNHLRKIVSRETALLWSKELGLNILPGSSVMMFNDHPRFFDISEVYVGAERTAFVLGKAASANTTMSVDIADAYGVTDSDIDKIAVMGKKGEIDKKIGGEESLKDFDGRIVAQANKLKDKIDLTNLRAMSREPEIDKDHLNAIAGVAPLSKIFSTMLGMGIQPKPREFQRIVLVNIGSGDIADALDRNNEVFDYENTDSVQPINLPICNGITDDYIGRILAAYAASRSAHPALLEGRFNDILEKTSEFAGDSNNNYWLESGPGTGSLIEHSKISPIAAALGGLAALYAGLKLKANGYSPKTLIDAFTTKPWLQVLVGGSIFNRLSRANDAANADDVMYMPASAYANILRDTNMTGHIKQSSLENAAGLGLLASGVILPGSYIVNAYNQKSLYRKGRPLFKGADTDPRKAAIVGGLAIGSGVLGYDKAKGVVGEALKKGLKNIR
jgi:hypothetical protein